LPVTNLRVCDDVPAHHFSSHMAIRNKWFRTAGQRVYPRSRSSGARNLIGCWSLEFGI
jgi:hypothetical protein